MILTTRSFLEPPSLGHKLAVLPADAGGSTSRKVDRRYEGVERGKLQTVAGIHGGYIGMTCVPCTDAANRGSAEEAHTPIQSLPSGFQTGVCPQGANQPTPVSHQLPNSAHQEYKSIRFSSILIGRSEPRHAPYPWCNAAASAAEFGSCL